MSVGVTVSGGTSVSVSIGGGIGPQGAAGAGGVTQLNTHTGAITLVGAGGASVSSVTAAGGATITITAGSGGGGGGLVDSVNGLTGTVVLSSVSVSAASAVHTHNAADITAGVFDRDRMPFATDKAVGAVQASAGLTVNGVGHLSADVRSVAGRTGAVTLSTTDVALFSSAAGAAAPVQSVQGRTGAVLLSVADITAAASVHTHSTTDVALFTAAAAAAAPVQSVNGSTGAVVLNAAAVTAAGTAVLTQLNGLTGAVQIAGVNITVATAGTAITLTGSAGGGGAVSSVAGATGTITITALGLSTSQSGSAVTLDARPVRVTPTTVSVAQNDWNLGAGDIFRIDNRTTSTLNITGFATTSSSLEVLVLNVSTHTAATFTLKHQHTSSTAANRIISQWGGDVVLASGGTAGHGAAVLVYDTTDSRWRVT